MKYLLYLKSSIKRRFKGYVKFLVMLICIAIIPLIMVFFRDSYINGSILMGIHDSGDSQIQFHNTKEEYLTYFDVLTDCHCRYDNGTIYVKQLYKFNDSQAERFNNEIAQIYNTLLSIPNSFVTKDDLTEVYYNQAYKPTANQHTNIIIILTFISSLILSAAYHIHLSMYKADIGILFALGATYKTMKKMLFMEFIALFTIAYAIGYTITYIIMYFIFKVYMQIDKGNTLVWMMFKADAVSAVILFIALLFIASIIFNVCFIKYKNTTPVALSSQTSNTDKLKHYKKKAVCCGSTAKTITNVLIRRSNKIYIYSLIIAIPTIITITIILNSLIFSIKNVSIPPEHDIIITCKDTFTTRELPFITDDNKIYLESIIGVKSVNYDVNIPVSYYFLLLSDNKLIAETDIEIEGIPCKYTQLKNFNNLSESVLNNGTGNFDEMKNENYIVLNKNHHGLSYEIGDKILLSKTKHSSAEVMDSDGNIITVPKTVFDAQTQFTVAGFVDLPVTESLVIYLNNEHYNKIASNYKSSKAFLELTDDADSVEIVEQINKDYYDVFYVFDEISTYKQSIKSTIGYNIMNGIISILLFISIIVILYMFISEYIRGQTSNIEIYKLLGTSDKSINKAYTLQALYTAITCVIVSCAAGTLLYYIYIRYYGHNMELNLTTFAIYITVALVSTAAFITPIHTELRK